MLLLAYFISVFPHFRRTEHSLRFCGIFYKDNTTLKMILNISFENSDESSAKLRGKVLCKLHGSAKVYCKIHSDTL